MKPSQSSMMLGVLWFIAASTAHSDKAALLSYIAAIIFLISGILSAIYEYKHPKP